MIATWIFVTVSLSCAVLGFSVGVFVGVRRMESSTRRIFELAKEYARRLDSIIAQPFGGRETSGIRRLKAIARGDTVA